MVFVISLFGPSKMAESGGRVYSGKIRRLPEFIQSSSQTIYMKTWTDKK